MKPFLTHRLTGRLPFRSSSLRSSNLRSLRRSLSYSLLLAAGLGMGSAAQANFTVTKTADTNDGACNTDCSLREAIAAANNNAGADAITFASGVSGQINLNSALPDLLTDLSITGPGAEILTVRRDVAAQFRIFTVGTEAVAPAVGPAVAISKLTISNGNVGPGDSDSSTFVGGGLLNLNGKLTVSECVFSGNKGRHGGGIFNGSYNPTNATLDISKCTFTNNAATASGINQKGQGGGLHNRGNLLVSACTFAGNKALYGSGVSTEFAARFDNCTLSGNEAAVNGGGFYVDIKDDGALALRNCTIVGNLAVYGGGGVYKDFGKVVIGNCIVVGNEYVDVVDNNPQQVSSAGYNLIGLSNNNVFTRPGDINRLSLDQIKLGTLQNNGGPTATMALLEGSPALNTGNTDLTTDQRGVARPLGGADDIGAFESPRTTRPLISISDATAFEGPDESGSNPAGGNLVFTVSLNFAAPQSVTVDYASEDVVAQAPGDYTPVGGTLTFDSGQTRQSITVPLVGDSVFEPSESLVIRLNNPVSATIGDDTGFGTIVNDDPASAYTLSGSIIVDAPGNFFFPQDVTITVRRQDGTIAGTTRSGTDGRWALRDVTPGTYTVTPGKYGYAFTPPSSQVTITKANVLVPPFTIKFRADFLVVTTTVDEDNGPGEPGRGTGNSLREAMNFANANPGLDVITFAPDLTGPALVNTPLPSPNFDTGINGASSDRKLFVIDGGNQTRLFEVKANVFLGLNNLRLQNGRGDGAGSGNPPNDATLSGGGAIYNSGGRLAISDCEFVGNKAPLGGAIYTSPLNGPVGQINFLRCLFADNRATNQGTAPGLLAGGAIYNVESSVTMVACTLRNNVVEGVGINSPLSGRGGAISNVAGTVQLVNCTLRSNQVMHRGFYSNRGGGLSNLNGTAFMENCTLSGNQSLSYQSNLGTTGGDEVFYPGQGGALFNGGTLCSLTLINCTLEGNSVYGARSGASVPYAEGDPRSGGAIYSSSKENAGATNSLTLRNCTLAGNTDTTTGVNPTVTIGTLVKESDNFSMRNTVFVASDAYPFDGFTAPTASGDANKNFFFRSLQTAGLDALRNNGGPVPTMALLPDSPLIDAGLSLNAPGVDARGVQRPQRRAVDVGAYELLSPGPTLLSVFGSSIIERDSGTQNMNFVVVLSRFSDKTVTVKATSFNGTAKAPGDFTARTVNLSFAPGETSKTFTMPVVGDTLNEAEENFYMVLSEPTNATIRDGRGVGTIIDNDAVPSISAADVTVQEGHDGTRVAAFTLKLSAPSGQIVKVNYATADGTAIANGQDPGHNDYVAAAPTTLAFPLGQTAVLVRVVINSDRLDEPNETFLLTLGIPINAVLSDVQAIGTIVDDDPLPSFSVSNVFISEGNPTDGTPGRKTVTFQVALTGPTAQVTSVNYATVNGTARAGLSTEGGDYEASSGTLTFEPHTGTQPLTATVNVTIHGDAAIERDEAFYLLLSLPTNGVIGVGRGAATILNDDAVGEAPPIAPSGDASK